MSVADVCTMYKTNTKTGIESQQRIEDMRAMYGPNALTPPKVVPWYCKLFGHMVGGFSLLLWFGSFLCFITYGMSPDNPDNMYLGVVLAVVVFLTGVFSW